MQFVEDISQIIIKLQISTNLQTTKMESYKSFVSSSQDQTKQIVGAKRALAASSVDVFASMSSKSDQYDHMKNHLQVSLHKSTTDLL